MSKTMSACPSCHALNNVDTDKAMAGKAVCGKCGQTLNMHGLTSLVNADDLRRIIRKADRPVIVDFYSDWCRPCKTYGTVFEQVSTKHPEYIFLKVNTGVDPAISQQMGIRGVPATIVFKDGQEYKRQLGALPEQMILNLVK